MKIDIENIFPAQLVQTGRSCHTKYIVDLFYLVYKVGSGTMVPMRHEHSEIWFILFKVELFSTF